MDVDDTASAPNPNQDAETHTQPCSAMHPHVASATEELDSLGRRPLEEHPDAYEQVHAHLSDALASVDGA